MHGNIDSKITLLSTRRLLFFNFLLHGGQAAVRELGITMVFHHWSIAFTCSVLSTEVYTVDKVDKKTCNQTKCSWYIEITCSFPFFKTNIS